MNGKTLLIVGNDKISAKALALLTPRQDIILAVDDSTSLKRLTRLIWRGSLSIGLIARMLWCELCRAAVPMPPVDAKITKNSDIIRLILRYKPRRVVLFRAGLIIDKKVLAMGVPIMNIHCAKVPEFGGIGSINRALHQAVYEQCATLHQVTETIDGGLVLDAESYQLAPSLSYCSNEERAYEAGYRLLLRTLQKPWQTPDISQMKPSPQRQ